MNFKTFARHAKGVGAIMALDRIVGLVIGMLFARWLGAEAYGVYAFGMATLVLLMVPARGGQPELLLRETAWAAEGKSPYAMPTFRRQAAKLIMLLSGMIALAALPFILLMDADHPNQRATLLWVLALLPLISLLDLVCSGLRGMGRIYASALMSTLLPGAILIGLLLAGSALGMAAQADLALALRVLATLAVVTFGGRILVQASPQVGDMDDARPRFRQLLAGGFPFMLLIGSSALLTRSDMFLLGLLGTSIDLAFYNIAFQAAVLVDFGLQISNSITTQEFARLHAAGRIDDLQRLAKSTARFTFLLAAGVLALLIWQGDALIALLFGEEFVPAYPFLLILAAGKAIALVFGEPAFILNMSGNEKINLRIFATAAFTNLCLLVVAIPLWGGVGAAFSAIISLQVWRFMAWSAVRSGLGISCAVF